jgi:putative ABC transport system permease protein
MISLAGRDILHSLGKFVFTGLGLGLLIGVTLTMAGVYRGIVDDGEAVLNNSGADLWVVQKDTLGPYAEPSILNDDTWRGIRAMPGIAAAANITYLTMQVESIEQSGVQAIRAVVTGIASGVPGTPGWPPYLVAGRQITRNHYEAVVDITSGFRLGEQIQIRREHFTVVGQTRRLISADADPMVFIPQQDAQQVQFLKDNDAIVRNRARTAENPLFNRPSVPGLLDAVIASQSSTPYVNAVLVQVKPGYTPDEVAASIRRWKRLTVYTREQMEDILIKKVIAIFAKQIGLMLIILTIVTTAIIAFIIYTLTLDKIREIAILKLIGTTNHTITTMIVQQAIGLGLIGFVMGKIMATFWGPFFPKYVLLEPADTARGFVIVVIICVLASLLSIRAALKVDPAEAIGG